MLETKTGGRVPQVAGGKLKAWGPVWQDVGPGGDGASAQDAW